MQRPLSSALLLAALLLAGCDMVGGALGIESPEKVATARDAEGKAVGAACRHAGRAIEDCYTMNKKADKAAVFAGWRDMNDYMRENKIEAVAPQLSTQLANAGAKAAAEAEGVKAEAAKAGVATEKPAPKAAEGAKPRSRAAAKAHDS